MFGACQASAAISPSLSHGPLRVVVILVVTVGDARTARAVAEAPPQSDAQPRARVTTGAKTQDTLTYGIATDKVKALERDIEDFRDVLTAPQASIADRTADTGAMRPPFNVEDAKFLSLGRVI